MNPVLLVIADLIAYQAAEVFLTQRDDMIEDLAAAASDLRFVIEHAGDPEYKLITRSSDGQLMLLVNQLSKTKPKTKLGSRIAEVHNGSLLFTGDTGQGESNIRQSIIENEWLEAIIAWL